MPVLFILKSSYEDIWTNDLINEQQFNSKWSLFNFQKLQMRRVQCNTDFSPEVFDLLRIWYCMTSTLKDEISLTDLTGCPVALGLNFKDLVAGVVTFLT